MKALLDAVLSEYAALVQNVPNRETDGESVKLYTVWVDQKNRYLYFSGKDGCVQKLFRNQQQLDAYIGILEMQGYTRKGDSPGENHAS